MKATTIEEKFWKRVEKADHCWIWLGCKDKDGYGTFGHRGKTLKAHRVSMEIHSGYKSSLCVLHDCDNPSCTNPEHLFWGTTLENNRDRARKGRGADKRGEKSPRAKFTEAQVRAIRQRYSSGGITQGELAQEFGVSRSAITNIVTGTRWRHLLNEVTL